MPLYPPATKRLIGHGSEDPPIHARAVVLHVAASNADTLYHWFNGPSGGVESHFYVLKSGHVEQYRDTAVQADAQEDANGFAISIETEGLEHGEWTSAQMSAIKDLINWCIRHHPGIPRRVIKSWDGSGIGYHVQFPGRWDSRHATCPGPDRQRQFWDELAPWLGSSDAGTGSAEWVPTGDMSTRDVQRAVGVAADGIYGPKTTAAVKRVQRKLGVPVDGKWGPDTERAWEAKNRAPAPRLAVDGKLGRKTIRALQREVGATPDGLMGPKTVRALQRWLGGVAVDGKLGPKTTRALQRKVGAAVDGEWGPTTTRHLQRWLNRH